MMRSLDFWSALALGVALAMDAFAVSLAAGASLRRIDFRRYFRLSFHFGLFQFMMPVCGWFLGAGVQHLVAAFDHWIAFLLLSAIGLRMIARSLKPVPDSSPPDPTRGLSLIGLSIAVSVDALAVGFSLAVLSISVWQPAAIVGVVAAAASLAGMRLGRALGTAFGRKTEFAGGIILIAIGLNIMWSHL